MYWKQAQVFAEGYCSLIVPRVQDMKEPKHVLNQIAGGIHLQWNIRLKTFFFTYMVE